MSLTKGDFGGFDRRRKDDGFKISLSKATFNYNLTHIFLCCVDFIFDSHCQAPGEEGVLAAPSISAVLRVGVCEMWLLSVDVEGVTPWKTRPGAFLCRGWHGLWPDWS